ncbi:MAG: hypothetical protein WBP03_05400 [Candidatus Saccharimonadales bacterium]|jgi:uncharacterized protein YdeI (YjbR/CyaY-like superfamily)
MASSPDLPIVAFATRSQLRAWLRTNHAISPGIMVQLFKKSSGIESVSFQDVLEEGLCFGWSESMRLPGDAHFYLQKFTPRRSKGTTSVRNTRLVAELERQRLMTDAGRAVL